VIVPPAPRRPAPGSGLAVLVVVTVLAALAAPHAMVLRGLVAAARPVIAAPAPPGARPASGSRAARGWHSRFASAVSPTGGAVKAPAPSTAQG
jgi:hypothetical protein